MSALRASVKGGFVTSNREHGIPGVIGDTRVGNPRPSRLAARVWDQESVDEAFAEHSEVAHVAHVQRRLVACDDSSIAEET
jgi:hypothetical protein